MAQRFDQALKIGDVFGPQRGRRPMASMIEVERVVPCHGVLASGRRRRQGRAGAPIAFQRAYHRMIVDIAAQFGGLAAADVAEEQHMPLRRSEHPAIVRRSSELFGEPFERLLATPHGSGVDITRVVRRERLFNFEFLQDFTGMARRLIGHEGYSIR